MTDVAAHKLYTPRTYPVHTAAAAVFLLSVPATAQIESAFAQFEARCLTPMAELRQSDVSGLNLLEEMGGRETWIPAQRDWHLTRAATDAVVQYCAIHGAFGAEVDAWAEAEVEAERYIRIDRTPETLQSTTWREPRIEIEIDREAPSLTVIETNLES